MKTVSVVMCTYNGSRYLREQLDSLMSQTYPLHELIVQDDGSTDGTVAIAEEYRQRYPEANITVFRNSRQLGFNRNFFDACSKASGELIACCDQDDIWSERKIEILARAMKENALVFHNSVLFNSQGTLGKLHTRQLPAYPSSLSALLMPQSFGHQIMFRKEVLGLIKPFLTLNLSYDYFIYTASRSLGRIRYINEPLVRWRRHDNAATFSGKKRQESKLDGYIRAVKALSLKKNRETARKYFTLCVRLHFADKDTHKAALFMSRGSLWNILKTCYLCLRHRKELVTDKSGIIQCLRAFFIPLYFIRDYGCYILKD